MIYKREDYLEESKEGAKFPVKHIEVLTPVDGGGATYVGQVTIGLSTPVGLQQIPVNFEIEASDIKDAFAKFEAAAEPKIEEARKNIEQEIDRLRREASSRIVRPDEVGLGGANLGGGSGLTGGGAGGGKIIDFKKP